MRKIVLLTFTMLQFWSSFSAQDDNEGSFFVGVNVGGFFANKQTAIMYTGGNIPLRGLDYYFPSSYGNVASGDSFYPEINDYFSYNYKLTNEGMPINASYKAALDIGFHGGVHLGGGNSIFIDVNSEKITFENIFVIEEENLQNSIESTLEQIPIFGEEKRLNVNLGLQLSLYNEDKLNAYIDFFGNFNSAKLESNYFVLNGKQYPIIHNPYGLNQRLPGGNGFGGGSGLGAKYQFNDKFTFDLNYNLYYTKVKMNDEFAPWGIHNAITFRIIWG